MELELELERLRRETVGIVNTTAHFMELAEQYMQQGKVESARACLILLCERVSNYEESLEWNDLTDTWNRYRYLVDGLVPSSIALYSAQPKAPQDCTVTIDKILAMQEDELLSALSEHLGKMSANGSSLNALNRWERIVYYADELWTEVNSGGFENYLYYYGTHFEKAYSALETLVAPGVQSLLDSVRKKFPQNCIPKSEESIQNKLDALGEQGIDFEQEDERFYSVGENELMQRLLSFVKENQKHFR